MYSAFITNACMFCLHIMNILDYLRADKFPDKYILKRYTKTAKSQPTFDTRDYNTIASDGSSKLSKQDILQQLNLMVNKKAMSWQTTKRKQSGRQRVGGRQRS